jgi:hypothetical protein
VLSEAEPDLGPSGLGATLGGQGRTGPGLAQLR